MTTRATYLARVWAARYFWTHLSLSDIRSRWRRSFFGLAWTVIQPLGMTLLLSVVFGRVFGLDFTSYAPYILSGIIVWEFITTSATGGALAFVQADAYIKQCSHPLAIYTLRTVLTNLIVLGLASLTLVGWVLVMMPENFGFSWLGALAIYPMVALLAWPLATILAYIATRFRDLPHGLGLALQAMWFVSPIYFDEAIFRRGGLDLMVDYNPIFHLLEIVRAPLLRGDWPSLTNYAFTLGMVAVLIGIACLIGRRAESRVIFYL